MKRTINAIAIIVLLLLTNFKSDEKPKHKIT